MKRTLDEIINKLEEEGMMPDEIIYHNTPYKPKKSCKLIEVFDGVYNPMCKKDLFLNYRDKNWRFCPFCGGELKEMESDCNDD